MRFYEAEDSCLDGLKKEPGRTSSRTPGLREAGVPHPEGRDEEKALASPGCAPTTDDGGREKRCAAGCRLPLPATCAGLEPMAGYGKGNRCRAREIPAEGLPVKHQVFRRSARHWWPPSSRGSSGPPLIQTGTYITSWSVAPACRPFRAIALRSRGAARVVRATVKTTTA